MFVLFVIPVQLFVNFTGWLREAGTHGEARAGRSVPIAKTKHSTILLREEFTDFVSLSFVITALKRKRKEIASKQPNKTLSCVKMLIFWP